MVQSGNPDIGLKAYGLVKPGIYDVVGYAMMSSPDLKSALQHFVRYCSLIDNGVDFFPCIGRGAPIVCVAAAMAVARPYHGSSTMSVWRR
ncbi:AraC family transcriptional regulator ligand-binding domain-containing protein [Azotobacter vinelandii]